MLSGVVGLQPFGNGTVLVNPLVPEDRLPWFAADGVMLHGKFVAVAYSLPGAPGCPARHLCAWADGKQVASRAGLGPLWVDLA